MRTGGSAVVEGVPRAAGSPVQRVGRGQVTAAQPCARSQSTTSGAGRAGSRRRSCRSPGRTATSTRRRGSGTPNGSRSPLTTSVGRPVSSSSARERSGRPGGCSGKASATTPAAPSARGGAAGHPGAAGPAADHQRQRSAVPGRASATTAVQASSRCAGRARARAGRRPGRAGSPGPPRRRRRSAASRTAIRSGASTPPPAPCPRTSRPTAGRPAASVSGSRPARAVSSIDAGAPAHGRASVPSARSGSGQLTGTQCRADRSRIRPAPSRSSTGVRRRAVDARSRQATSIARRSRGVVPPQTPWQSPTSSAQARHGPCTSQVRQSATAVSAGSFGAGKNVSGSTCWHAPRVRQASSCCRSPRPAAVAGRAARRRPRAGVASAPVSSTHLPRGTGNPPMTDDRSDVHRADRQPPSGAVFYRTRDDRRQGFASNLRKSRARSIPDRKSPA